MKRERESDYAAVYCILIIYKLLDSEHSEQCIDFTMFLFFFLINFSGSRHAPIFTYDTSKYKYHAIVVLYRRGSMTF